MAYVNQELKKRIEALCKPVFKKYGIKARLGVQHHSNLICNISSGPIDFGGDRIQVNHFHYETHYTGKALDFFNELIPLLQSENYDKSDIQTDYFSVGYYLSINVGQWNKPYILTHENV